MKIKDFLNEEVRALAEDGLWFFFVSAALVTPIVALIACIFYYLFPKA
jgi:hypothetical protein